MTKTTKLCVYWGLCGLFAAIGSGCDTESGSASTADSYHQIPDITANDDDGHSTSDTPGLDSPGDLLSDSEPQTGVVWGCEPDQIWLTPMGEYSFVYGRPRLSLSPNGRLALLADGFSTMYLGTENGRLLGFEGTAGMFVGDSWTDGLTVVNDRIDAVELASGDLGVNLPLESQNATDLEWLAHVDVSLSKDGRLAAAVACWQAEGGPANSVWVTVWELESGLEKFSTPLKEHCSELSWLDRSLVRFVGNKALLVNVPGSAWLHSLDVETGEISSAPIAQDTQPGAPASPKPEGYVPYVPPVIDLAVSPDESVAAAVLQDGSVRILSLPEMKETGVAIDAGFAGINLWTYGPSTVGPVAWSNDGNVLAHMSTDGRVVMSKTIDAQEIVVLDNPALMSSGAHQESVNPPVALAFSPDDRGLLVVYESGTALWGCAAPAYPPPSQLVVSIAGPDSAVESQPSEWMFQHDLATGPAIHTLAESGSQTVLAASITPRVKLHLAPASTFTLVGRVDSGDSIGQTTEVSIDVMAYRK